MCRLVRETDIPKIKKWYKSRKIEDQTEMFSTIGYIVEGTAAGFLYITNSKIALIEHLISNPNADKKKIDESLDKIVNQIIQKAKELNFEFLLGITEINAVEKRANRLGFLSQSSTYKTIIYNLMEK